ncbi:MAG: DUF4476 domain-containing protein [Bacteroidetes bacterium]|nr:DUF4476 domain-containing protein [Bacteroidota bacterium]
MKRTFFLFWAFLLTVTELLQAQAPCTTPMPTARFRQKYDMIVSLSSEVQRLNRAKGLAKDEYLSSSQVKELADLFINDYNRLDFVQTAYGHITDKENFYEVYDAFAYLSNAMRLYDFVHSVQQPPPPPPLVVVTEPQFPALNYPDYNNYMGPSSCHPPLAENDFIVIIKEVFNQNSEAARLLIAGQVVQSNCLSTAQVMKTASLLSLENNRLSLVKTAFGHTYDVGNYTSLTQLFTHLPYRNSLMEFINENATPPPPPPPPPCSVNHEELTQVLESINKQSFNSTKVTVAKQIIIAKKCFKTSQIKEILKLFSFEDSKLEMAKFAYDFCTDKQNYFSVNDVFSYSSSVEELAKFVNGKH